VSQRCVDSSVLVMLIVPLQDKDRLAKRSLSAATGLAALRAI
jgi:hypothetical protein